MAIVGAHGPRRQFHRDDDLDEDPLEPAVTRRAECPVRRLAAGTAGRGDHAGIGREAMARGKAVDVPDLRPEEQRAKHPNARQTGKLFHDRVAFRRFLHVPVERGDFRVRASCSVSKCSVWVRSTGDSGALATHARPPLP